VIAGVPVTCSGGSYQVVQGLDLNDFSRSRLDVTVKELKDEREMVKQLDLI
jgi:malate dehydrogenase